MLVNANGTVVNANTIALEAFETPGTALVGRGLLDLLPQFDSKLIPGSMRRPDHMDPRGRTKPTRMTARRTDGTEFPVEVTSANLENGQQAYDGYGYSSASDELLMLVVRDLSGTVDTEAELARSQRQTEMILRAAAEGVVGTDTDGRIVLVNPAAAQILGYRASDLGGKELHTLVLHSRADGSPFPYDESPLADTLRSGRKHRVRGQVLWSKGGDRVSVDLTTAPVYDGDQLVGAVMTFTDRRPYDALAEEKDSAEKRHKELKTLLSRSLHAPLMELHRELGALAADDAGQLWPEANLVLHQLTADCSHLTTVIDNILGHRQSDSRIGDTALSETSRQPFQNTVQQAEPSPESSIRTPQNQPETSFPRLHTTPRQAPPTRFEVRKLADRTSLLNVKGILANSPERQPETSVPPATQAAEMGEVPRNPSTHAAVEALPESIGSTRRLMVWPTPEASMHQMLSDRGYRPVVVHSREEVDAQIAAFPAALFVDPLTGPITRTALQSLRTAAVAAEVPVLVTAGLGQATREAAVGADPAVLLKALAPRDSEQHAARVLLIEEHAEIALALTSAMERRGMQVARAASDADAVALAGQLRPNLVVMDLMQVHRRQAGILDWLRANGQLNRTPLVVYTAAVDQADLPRLASGETVLFLAERSTSPEVQTRIVDLLARIGTR
ncbi:PAS domain-containing protein [Streptomyces sp. NBC_00199]|uniref:PAS domain-containing protein n=1 Tax=Streptomyces sp. NBC_00199 TaxID=2975678 RepID=UPI002250D14F|nr:PAS domain-containing protein [Streptomyces sp. NBC_00199]MCX5269978.1 PAS domain-containing protein [Streptomyces sp. NBC_00199]